MPPLADTPWLTSLLRPTDPDHPPRSKPGGVGRLLRMLKLLPALSSGCKMAALLHRPGKPFLADPATIATLFGPRRGRATLAVHDDTRSPPLFLIELPIPTASLHHEMASGVVRLALETDTRTQRKKITEEYVWAVFCNGRKFGYAIRRKHAQASDDDRRVMGLLRGVSMGAGVLPCSSEKEAALDGEMTYMRARFQKVVGSKDSLALYMINPDGSAEPELSIFLVRVN